MRLCPNNKNSKENWDAYFQGEWERRNGRLQTRLFARYFLETVRLPKSAHTLIDVGCAMGDGLPEIAHHYKHLQLHGCDISPRAIKQARQDYGHIAAFHQWGFEDIEGDFDIIYCSNTLEHFTQYLDIARALLDHCQWLYILVPFRERVGDRALTPQHDQWHVASFGEGSFDALVTECRAQGIRTWLHSCPGAWSTHEGIQLRWRRAIWQTACKLRHKSFPAVPEKMQIFYELEAVRW
ncbi:class I SAM-dependent methyltransferase [bacterium]|nr:class I SAM-dependent methyltransferase [bacterium]